MGRGTRAWLGWPALLLVVVLPMALFVPGLGSSGFAHSEAFRAQPAWEMLANGDWLVVRLFDQPYLRKPPAMIWAIAASSSLLGETVFAARMVSVVAMVVSAVLSWWFCRRWFGAPAGLVAGLATTLLPILSWYPPVSRSAEIEALHNMFVLGAMLVIFDVVLAELRATAGQPARPPLWPVAWLKTLALAVAIGGALLTKGPAGVPAIAGVLLVAVVVRRVQRLPFAHAVWLPIVLGFLLGAAAFGAWWLLAARALARLGEPVVTQAPSEFLFGAEQIVGITTLPLAAAAIMLPVSLVLHQLPWRTHAGVTTQPRTQRLARALPLAIIAGVGISMLVGIANQRYILPVIMLAPACAGAWVWWRRAGPCSSDASRRELTKELAVGAAVLTVALSVIVWRGDVRRANRTSGEPAGLALGQAIVRDMQARGVTRAQVWGDQMIDTRPEVLIAATREVTRAGMTLQARWKPLTLEPTAPAYGMLPSAVPLPEVGSYVIVRQDLERRANEPPAEWTLYESTGVLDRLTLIFEGKVHIFPFAVYRRVRE